MSPTPRRSTLIYLMLAWLTMVAIAGTLLVTAEIRRLEQQFRQATDALAAVVKNRLDTNETVLSGLVAFLLAVEEDDYEATQRYAASVASTYPHIHMVEIARRVPAHEIADFVTTLQQTWRRDFALKTFPDITGRSPVAQAPPGDTWPILFLYPPLPEVQPIYGLQLETVDYLTETLARTQGHPHAVTSPVFELFEGGMGYILLQSVERPPHAQERNTPNFFGNTMAAMLVIRSEALLADVAPDVAETTMNITLGLINNDGKEGTLTGHHAEQKNTLSNRLLPVFERTEIVAANGQRVTIGFRQQQHLRDIFRPETVVIFTLLFCAVFLAPLLMLRHYRALVRANIEHEQSAYLATHDVLTGLPNRFLLADRFELILHDWKRNGTPFAVILLDLDHFKEINDRYGHEVGDHVLRTAAERMTDQLRACDTVARYGGDEFIILLTQTAGAPDALQVGGKILSTVSLPMTTPGGPLEVSCSLGIAVCPDHGTDFDTLRRCADMAMYAAKQSGRRTAVLSPSTRMVP
jgi:diguanylate cyclase